MKQSLCASVGSSGLAQMWLSTDMETGKSTLQIDVCATVAADTSSLKGIRAKWSEVEKLRSEFHARLEKIIEAGSNTRS